MTMTMTMTMTATVYMSTSLPTAVIVSNIDGWWIVPTGPGWQERRPYRGYKKGPGLWVVGEGLDATVYAGYQRFWLRQIGYTHPNTDKGEGGRP